MRFAYVLYLELGGNGLVWDWLKVISWHQLVEWYQFYLTNPFGEERADLRSAIAGCTIANEIRAIAGGLAGKSLKMIQVKDLLFNFEKRNKEGEKSNDYYKRWETSIKQQLARHQKESKALVKRDRS